MRLGHPTREKLDMDWSIARGSDSPFPYTLDPIWKNLKMNIEQKQSTQAIWLCCVESRSNPRV